MAKNSLLIPVKIAGAMGSNMYDQKMENATLIREAARELIEDSRALQLTDFKKVKHLESLKNDIEEFRILFAEWVTTFEASYHISDP